MAKVGNEAQLILRLAAERMKEPSEEAVTRMESMDCAGGLDIPDVIKNLVRQALRWTHQNAVDDYKRMLESVVRELESNR